MTIDLPLEKARQHLLKYFKTRDDMELKSSKPNSIRIHTSGSRHPWINIKIGISEEENGAKLSIDFSFRTVYAIITLITLGVLAVVWIFAVNIIEAIVISTIIGIMSPVTLVSGLNKAKRKFLKDIRKAFNKTD